MKTLLLALSFLASAGSMLAFSQPAHADGSWIEIGPDEAIDCKNQPNHVLIVCNPYRHEHVHDDPFSPAFALRQDLGPWQRAECLHDAAGGIVFTCSIPEGWVDPNPPPPPAPPAPPVQPSRPDPQHDFLVSTFNAVDQLMGVLANEVNSDKGARLSDDAIARIDSYAEGWRVQLGSLVFVAPSSCAADCSQLDLARESLVADINAFRGTTPEQYTPQALAKLKGEAQAAYNLLSSAAPPPALTAQDVCQAAFYGDTGSSLFTSGSFGVHTTITSAGNLSAQVRMDYTGPSGQITETGNGTCQRTAPDTWMISGPYRGQQLQIKLVQTVAGSKALAAYATYAGRAIQIRH
jgi:hypothetical protein